MNENITAKVYSLQTEKGGWLGEIVLTSDGMFAAITDWGNFNFAWRAYGKDESFENFILSLDVCYFANKMYQGMTYVADGRKIQQAAERFAEKILPALKKAILDNTNKR